MSEQIKGLWCAVTTPIDASGSVDVGRLRDHTQWLFSEGVDGIVPFGTTGEGASFSSAERISVIGELLKSGISPDRIGLGVGMPALTETISVTRSALGLGLTHCLVLPPYFYRDATDEGLEDYFSSYIDHVADDRLRMTLYHIPQVAGIGIPARTAGSLRKRYGKLVAGLKDSSGDFKQFQAFRAHAPEVAVTVGNEPDIVRAVAEGGAGTICGMANIVPRLVRALVDGTGDVEQMSAITAIFSGRPFVPTLKAIMAERSGQKDWLRVRPALREATDGTALVNRLKSITG